MIADDPVGFSTAIATNEPSPAGAGVARLSRRERRLQRLAGQRPPRRLTWRVAIFAVLFLAVLGAAAGAIGWYARNTYYVGVQDDAVTIFRGKPDGVLWFDPTVERVVEGVGTDDLSAAARDNLAGGVEFGSLEEAESYVSGLTTTTTSTTTSTTTTSTSTTSTTPTTAVAPTVPPPSA